MIQQVTKSSLSKPRQELIRIMQSVGFGRIEGLSVQHGEPVIEPPPRIVQEIKLGSNEPVADYGDDFNLKSQVVDLFRRIESLHHGEIDVIEIQHGLPFRMTISVGN